MRKSIVTSAVLAGAMVIGGAGFAAGAEAAAAQNTGTHTSTLVSAKCYDYKSTSVTRFSWSSTKHSYVVHSPRTTVSTYRHCHA